MSDFPFTIHSKLPHNGAQSGSVTWQCPSNIAIVKYWGKYGNQLPKNTSLSLTLSNAHTITTVTYNTKNKEGVSLDFTFEGNKNEKFEAKLTSYFEKLTPLLPFINGFHFSISSSNSFPHSSGIASSASGMGAIAMCLCDIECNLVGIPFTENTIQKASYIARLGSGSASRSVIPRVSTWGEHVDLAHSSNLFASPVVTIHPAFDGYHDDILIVSSTEKSVSSTAGHALMDTNPYAQVRYKQANERLTQLQDILQCGDVDAFGKLAEEEALTLHALMMCSDPSYILMEAKTLDIIKEIRHFRAETKLPVYFTLDAGPNIHLLYPDHISADVDVFIKDRLMPHTINNTIIKDKIGNGPIKIV